MALIVLVVLEILLHLTMQVLPATPRIHASTVPSAQPEADIMLQSAAAAGRGAVIITFVRWEQADEAANYIAHLRAAGLLGALVAIALDDASVSMLRELGVKAKRLAVSPLEPKMSKIPPSVSLAARLQGARWRYLSTVVHAGYRVWLSDLRVLWRRGPLPLVGSSALQAGCSVAFAAGSPSSLPSVTVTPSDSSPATVHPSLTLSMYDAGPLTTVWLQRIARLLEDNRQILADDNKTTGSDAALLGEVARCSHAPGGIPGLRAGHTAEGECPQICMLSADEFPNGLRVFQQPLDRGVAGVPEPEPIAIVADWLPSHRFAYRLREAGLWRGPAAVRDEPGARFIAFKELLINNGLSNTRNISSAPNPHYPSPNARLSQLTLICPQRIDLDPTSSVHLPATGMPFARRSPSRSSPTARSSFLSSIRAI